MNTKYRYITICGPDGIGKTTLLLNLQTEFKKTNKNVYLTKGLGGDGSCDLQKALRAALLHPKFPSNRLELEESLFSLADEIGTADAKRVLETTDATVLKDRGVASHYVYAVARGLASDTAANLHKNLFDLERSVQNEHSGINILLVPDQAEWLLKRIQARSLLDGTQIVDRLESLEMQKRVISGMKSFPTKMPGASFNVKIVNVSETDSTHDVLTNVIYALSRA